MMPCLVERKTVSGWGRWITFSRRQNPVLWLRRCSSCRLRFRWI